jgi:hypothetical protein
MNEFDRLYKMKKKTVDKQFLSKKNELFLVVLLQYLKKKTNKQATPIKYDIKIVSLSRLNFNI